MSPIKWEKPQSHSHRKCGVTIAMDSAMAVETAHLRKGQKDLKEAISELSSALSKMKAGPSDPNGSSSRTFKFGGNRKTPGKVSKSKGKRLLYVLEDGTLADDAGNTYGSALDAAHKVEEGPKDQKGAGSPESDEDWYCVDEVKKCCGSDHVAEDSCFEEHATRKCALHFQADDE